MMYILDHHALIYMLEQFPRNLADELWTLFENSCEDGTIISQRESKKCLENEAVEPTSIEWSKKHSDMFKTINSEEAAFLGELMDKKEFDFFSNPQLAERRIPEALPFILAVAKQKGLSYVYRKNTNTDYFKKIKKICDAYEISYLEIEDCLLKLYNSHRQNV